MSSLSLQPVVLPESGAAGDKIRVTTKNGSASQLFFNGTLIDRDQLSAASPQVQADIISLVIKVEQTCAAHGHLKFDPQVEYTLRGVKENGQPDVGMYLKLDLPDFLLKSSRPEFEAYAKKEIAQAAAPFIEALKVNYKDVFTRFNPHAHLKALLEPQPVPEMAKTFALVFETEESARIYYGDVCVKRSVWTSASVAKTSQFTRQLLTKVVTLLKNKGLLTSRPRVEFRQTTKNKEGVEISVTTVQRSAGSVVKIVSNTLHKDLLAVYKESDGPFEILHGIVHTPPKMRPPIATSHAAVKPEAPIQPAQLRVGLLPSEPVRITRSQSTPNLHSLY